MSATVTIPSPSLDGWLLSRDTELGLRLRVAREAQASWAKIAVSERATRLNRVADALLDRTDALVALLRDENGKQAVEALGHEVGSAANCVRWLCEAGPDLLGTKPVSVAWMLHRTTTIDRTPFGVVVVISPWNFPLSIPLGQVVAGLLAGNAVILKPSEVTPRVGNAIADLLATAGLPPNLFQLVQGDGRVGAELIAHRPDKVFFTGSNATGKKVMAACAAFPIPVSLELGGIDALIVCDDADLELATSAAVWGAFMNGGQVCASVERILVDERVHAAFMGRLLQKIAELDPVRDLGRVTMERQGQTYERHVADAKKRGLNVLTGGDWLRPRVFAPTVIEGRGIEAADVYRDETFGPIVAVATFRGDDEAVRKHNDTDFGLTASVFAGDRARGERLAKRLDAGLIAVNDVAATLHAFGELPWGGKGASGFGRSHGTEGLLEFTWPKVIDRPRQGVPDFKRPWWFPYDPDQTYLLAAFVEATAGRKLVPRLRAAGRMTRALFTGLRRAPRS
jgi:acyl-CoA reductase-like NAD-dependent aldehyde dehydrogenase